MLSVEDATARLLGAVGPTPDERVPLADGLGRVPSGVAITASGDVPPFANSAMDGFAVRAADGAAPRRVVGESRAGGPPAPAVEPGTAVRIMTGAPMPDGADAVVPVEVATERDGVLTVEPPQPGTHVRAAGHDVRAGATVELPPAPITASVIGLLAALGQPEVSVRRRPRVAILSTGDELRAPGEALGHGQIFDANGPSLAAAVTEAGGEPVVLERAPDDSEAIEARLRDAVERGADLLLASGGVSVGAHDHVRTVIERVGALDFWRIAVQPGKPLAFGHAFERPLVGLPGNPVSALVTFELFVRPMVRAMLGLAGDGRERVRAVVEEALRKDEPRRAYLRVRVERRGDGYVATSAGGQASSQLLPLAAANALLVVPEGAPATIPGETYEAILLGAVA